MLEGVYVDNIMMHSETRVYPTEPQLTAGLMPGTESFYRYGLRESSYPTLSLVDELTDANGNIIHNETINRFQYLKAYFEPLN